MGCHAAVTAVSSVYEIYRDPLVFFDIPRGGHETFAPQHANEFVRKWLAAAKIRIGYIQISQTTAIQRG